MLPARACSVAVTQRAAPPFGAWACSRCCCCRWHHWCSASTDCKPPAPSPAGLIYQAIGVTITAYILWYWALGTGSIARVGLFQFLQPVSGVILAYFMLSEQLSLTFVLASAVIMLGVILAFRANY